MKATELSTQLTNLTAQVNKVKAEVLKRITDLEAALSNVDLPEEAVIALDGLKTALQAVDDINPDAPAGTP